MQRKIVLTKPTLPTLATQKRVPCVGSVARETKVFLGKWKKHTETYENQCQNLNLIRSGTG